MAGSCYDCLKAEKIYPEEQLNGFKKFNEENRKRSGHIWQKY